MSASREIINAGISGLGRSGWDIHANLLSKMPDMFRVAAVCDPIKSRCAEAQTRFGCRVHDSFDSLADDPEIRVVVVASPSCLHAAQAVRALEAGKSVVCEKPMATNLTDADRMIAAAGKSSGKLTVFQCCRYDADFAKIREVIGSGKLGRIAQIKMAWQGFGRRWDWQTLQEFGGGALNNTGPHMMDIALQFLNGRKAGRIFCHMDRALVSGDAEDHVTVIIETDGAPTLNLEISSCCAYPENAWLVQGTQGTLTGSRSALKWKFIDPAKLPPRPLDRNPTPDRSYNSEKLEWTEETWGESDGVAGRAYSSAAAALGKGGPFYEDLHDLLTKGEPFPITLEQVREQIRVFEECHRQSGFWK